MTVEITTVSPSWVESNLADVTPVDVREPHESGSLGRVPGSVNVPFGTVRDRYGDAPGMLPDAGTVERAFGDAGISSDDDLLAYDARNGVEAARLLLTAAVYGHEGDLYLLEGDIETWQRDHDTETGRPDPDPTRYGAAGLNSAALATRSAVEAAIDGGATLVDTRTAAEYEAAHLPGAVRVSPETLVDDTGRPKPDPELRSILSERGLALDDEIVLYCNTARRLSYVYAVLSALGYGSVRFYEGNLTDWIRAKSPKWDPEQLYEDVREAAPKGFDALPEALGDDVFSRLHLVGLYTVRQDGYFMLRTKVPGGQLSAEQARAVGEIAEEFATAPPEHGGAEQNPIFGDGFLDITTRQGIQLHWIEAEDVPEIWDRYESVGLTTLQASGNTLRNVVSCPAAGLADETIDPAPVAADVADTFEGDRRYANLPRKLKVSVAGCHENCGRAEIQDLGFTPAVKDGRDGFAVKVGGGLSDGPRAATDLGIFVEPEQVSALSTAAAELFIEHGRYLDTAVNRLKFIVDEWGLDRFRAELETYAPFEFEPYDESRTTDYRGDHVGVHKQDDGRRYVGLNVPTGRIRGHELIELADLAETYGSGELRATPNQNLLIAGVDPADVEALLAEPILEEYSPDPGPFSRGIVTCTGREFCKYGVVETKSRGHRLATELDAWIESDDGPDAEALPEAVRVHMSGCSASCAQPQIGDIGTRGEAYRDEERSTAAVDVGLGGDLGSGQFVDWVSGRLPLESFQAAIQRLLERFAAERRPGESFAEWTDRTDADRLDRIVRNDRQAIEAD